jgi:hypothetical protein
MFLLLRFGLWVKIVVMAVYASAEIIKNNIEASGELSKYQAPGSSWFKHYGTSWKVEVSIPDEIY